MSALLSVPEMSCDHCRASIQKALSALSGAGTITVDLDRQRVHTDGPAPAEQVIAALEAIGFAATPVSA